MCGIAGYIGGRNVSDVLFNMLKRLEYRGYDSAGVAIVDKEGLFVAKNKGRVEEIEGEMLRTCDRTKIHSSLGMGHCRWATHGVPSKKNAHPHTDCKGKFVVVHNGIIENYKDLKQELIGKGHKFESETDTEVIPHLIEEFYTGDFEAAFIEAIKKLKGSFAIAAITPTEADKILMTRKESPLIVGLGKNENFVASDIPAVLPETKRVIILQDFDYGIIRENSVVIKDLKTGAQVERETQIVEWDIREAEKAGYEHFMLKEIFEEPYAAKNALKGVKEIKEVAKKLAHFKRIYFVACGTAAYAGLVGKYLLERFGISSEAVMASEFRYSTANTLYEDCAVIAISQSGETADTIACAREAKRRNSRVVSVVNVVGSTLTRLSDDNVYIYAGPEIAVASTKAYIGQLVSLTLLSLFLAKERGKINDESVEEILSDLKEIPDKIGQILSDEREIRKLAENLADKNIFFYIGRRLNYPTALEGALKIKEISYVHAEAYPAGELKHGPLALLEEGVPVVAISPNDDLASKMESNIEEAKARNATVLLVSEGGDLNIPAVNPLLSPILCIVPLHLFAYYISVSKGIDPDRPRNLAKSVTVE
ncbi:MAG: glutamine--fructose-6-phosphate transaminase (isomerizing) [Actinomycetota bacterium]|nr:glutamine--fructose-6-phosphate transaminase (isomerizing) [Actinomycetota bacterium]